MGLRLHPRCAGHHQQVTVAVEEPVLNRARRIRLRRSDLICKLIDYAWWATPAIARQNRLYTASKQDLS